MVDHYWHLVGKYAVCSAQLVCVIIDMLLSCK